MPAAWIMAGEGLLGMMSGGSGSSSPTTAFSGPNTGTANNSWLNGIQGLGTVANAGGWALPGIEQSYNQSGNINYDPYLQAANTQGQQYGTLANTAGQQANMYGGAAQQAQGQEQQLYGAGNQIMQQAFNTNGAQYNMDANNLAGQVNAGQAARGLGNSPVGGQEFNNAMSNFGTQWNTQQLQNEATGASAMGNLNNAGANQGQMMGAMNAGQLGAGQAQAGYTGQAASVPLNAQQYAAAQPGVNAATYAGQLGNIGSLFGNETGAALPYITGGNGAQQYNTGYNTAQNTANSNLLMNSLGANSGNSATNPNSWLTNMFGGSSGAGGQMNNPGSTYGTTDLLGSLSGYGGGV